MPYPSLILLDKLVTWLYDKVLDAVEFIVDRKYKSPSENESRKGKKKKRTVEN